MSPPPPDAAPRLDVPTLRAQLEGTQLLDALRLHRIGTPDLRRYCVPCWCCLLLAWPFHAFLIISLLPAPRQKAPGCLLLVLQGLLAPLLPIAGSAAGHTALVRFPHASLGASCIRLDLH